MIFSHSGQLAELRLALESMRAQIDEMRRDIAALTVAVGKAAFERGDPSPAVDSQIVLRMLASIEELSGKFYQVWERDKAAAREQRKNARKVGVEKQAARTAQAAALPSAVVNCSACMDAIDGGHLAGPLDQLKHAREEHDLAYKEFLKPRGDEQGQ